MLFVHDMQATAYLLLCLLDPCWSSACQLHTPSASWHKNKQVSYFSRLYFLLIIQKTINNALKKHLIWFQLKWLEGRRTEHEDIGWNCSEPWSPDINSASSRKEKVAFDSEKIVYVLIWAWELSSPPALCAAVFLGGVIKNQCFRRTIPAVQRRHLLRVECETGAVYGPLVFILALPGCIWHTVTDNKEGVSQTSLLTAVTDSVCVCDEITLLGITLHWFSSQYCWVVKLPLCF